MASPFCTLGDFVSYYLEAAVGVSINDNQFYCSLIKDNNMNICRWPYYELLLWLMIVYNYSKGYIVKSPD